MKFQITNDTPENFRLLVTGIVLNEYNWTLHIRTNLLYV